MVCECYFGKYIGFSEWWGKNKKIKMNSWLLFWVSKEKFDVIIENKKVKKGR